MVDDVYDPGVGKGVVIVEGHNLMPLEWLKKLADVSVWVTTPLRRCAAQRIRRRNGFRCKKPCDHKDLIDFETDKGWFSQIIKASNVRRLTLMADFDLALEGPQGVPAWSSGPDAAQRLDRCSAEAEVGCEKIVVLSKSG